MESKGIEVPAAWVRRVLTERREHPVKRKDGTDVYPPRWFEAYEYFRGNLRPGESVAGGGGVHSRFLYRESSLEECALNAYRKSPPKNANWGVPEVIPEDEILKPEGAR